MDSSNDLHSVPNRNSDSVQSIISIIRIRMWKVPISDSSQPLTSRIPIYSIVSFSSIHSVIILPILIYSYIQYRL